MTGYLTISRPAAYELTVERSRFIGQIAPVTDEDEALRFIERVKAAHPQANHNVYAYVLADGGRTRCSDDGESRGTAGLPVLDILRKEDITDAVVVVTRYFGGKLLGKGGLVRAYSQAAKGAVEAAGLMRMEPALVISVEAEYNRRDSVFRLMTQTAARIVSEEYGTAVHITAVILEKDYAAFCDELTRLTANEVIPLVLRKINEKIELFCEK